MESVPMAYSEYRKEPKDIRSSNFLPGAELIPDREGEDKWRERSGGRRGE